MSAHKKISFLGTLEVGEKQLAERERKKSIHQNKDSSKSSLDKIEQPACGRQTQMQE